MNVMHVTRAGMLTTFQDGGRRGFQKYGVQVGGPMDEWAHEVANLLVGNAPDAALLECTLTGPGLTFTQNTVIALCGARMSVTADGMPLPYDRALAIRRGTVLKAGACQQGARLYIAVRGEPAFSPVLNSRSTNLHGRFGGLDGRPLSHGDKVVFQHDQSRLPIESRLVNSGLPVVLAPNIDVNTAPTDEIRLRLVKGAHWPAFNEDAQTALVQEEFVMQSGSDRQGIRLQGANLQLHTPLELVSEATVFGTVQVPPDGNPIVLMADRQSAGGYPKMATVAGVDLPRLAQCVPGDRCRFTLISQSEAEQLWQARCRALMSISEQAMAALNSEAD